MLNYSAIPNKVWATDLIMYLVARVMLYLNKVGLAKTTTQDAVATALKKYVPCTLSIPITDGPAQCSLCFQAGSAHSQQIHEHR